MSRSLPPGAIVDEEEGPQLWSAQPINNAAATTHSSTAVAAAAAESMEDEDGADADDADNAEQHEEDDDGDVIADPYFGDADGMVGEEEETEEPWTGATAAAAADAASASAAEAVDAAADADESKEGYAADALDDGDDEEGVEVDEDHVPQVGDLTAAFFSEMSAGQQSGGSASKRAKHSHAAADGNDSDEDYGVVQSRAFAIPSHLLRNFDPQSTGEPQSAEEYLLRVRVEAQNCPRVKTAKHIDPKTFVHRQTAYMPALGLVPRPANPLCLPSEEWQNCYSNEFAQARQQLVSYAANHSHVRKYTQPGTPHRRDYAVWTTWCVGNVQQQIAAAAVPTAPTAAAVSADAASSSSPSAAAASVSPPALLPHCPSLPLVISMDQLQTKGILQSLLELGTDLINKRKREAEQHAARAAVAATSADAAPLAPMPPFLFPSHAYTLWLYTLLLKVDKPIASPLASSMRAAYRALSWIRAHDNRPEGDIVKFANMMTTILDKSFGQRVEFAE